MRIFCFKLLPNPLPDFKGEFIPEPIALDIDDDAILRLGKRFIELTSKERMASIYGTSVARGQS